MSAVWTWITWQLRLFVGGVGNVQTSDMKTIDIEVTLFEKVKCYTVNPMEVTGVENEAIAVMAIRQAFISAGSPLAKEKWLAANPVPAGTKQTDWLKTGTAESVKDDFFPTPDEVMVEATIKALKALNRESGANAALAKTAAMLGVSVADLLALKK